MSRTRAVPTAPEEVRAVLAGYPPSVRAKLERIRALIFKVAVASEGVGPVTETLKWGEPAYLTTETGAGSTIRLGWKKSVPEKFAMYFICRTDLVDTFRSLYPELTCEGNRAVVFDVKEALPLDAVASCIEIALTYHLSRKALGRTGRRLRVRS